MTVDISYLNLCPILASVLSFGTFLLINTRTCKPSKNLCLKCEPLHFSNHNRICSTGTLINSMKWSIKVISTASQDILTWILRMGWKKCTTFYSMMKIQEIRNDANTNFYMTWKYLSRWSNIELFDNIVKMQDLTLVMQFFWVKDESCKRKR